ncbi:hypothetical protein LABF186_07670 [Lactobacillus amylovorus subsp. animalium]|uniref:Phage holin n=1 Tax=Lactobacillus amylovorus subsp. animalium TaxID=3378536 RepID=A0ABD0C2Y9_LACAM|nr:hypothetical protein LABF186_07670 [Lactobacillus amylovorus]GMM16189.1 hypothetical protein LABF125_13230 [Lactobacillus amylovorus]
MTVTQLTDYILIVVLALVAICQGISTGIDFFASKSKKPLPKEVMTINEIAKFVVSEAATLDVSGAEKKAQAVQALLNQAKKEGKPITESVAKGAVQHAYDQAKQEKEKATPVEDETAKPIGFVSGDDQNEG